MHSVSKWWLWFSILVENARSRWSACIPAAWQTDTGPDSARCTRYARPYWTPGNMRVRMTSRLQAVNAARPGPTEIGGINHWLLTLQSRRHSRQIVDSSIAWSDEFWRFTKYTQVKLFRNVTLGISNTCAHIYFLYPQNIQEDQVMWTCSYNVRVIIYVYVSQQTVSLNHKTKCNAWIAVHKNNYYCRCFGITTNGPHLPWSKLICKYTYWRLRRKASISMSWLTGLSIQCTQAVELGEVTSILI